MFRLPHRCLRGQFDRSAGRSRFLRGIRSAAAGRRGQSAVPLPPVRTATGAVPAPRPSRRRQPPVGCGQKDSVRGSQRLLPVGDMCPCRHPYSALSAQKFPRPSWPRSRRSPAPLVQRVRARHARTSRTGVRRILPASMARRAGRIAGRTHSGSLQNGRSSRRRAGWSCRRARVPLPAAWR